MHICYLWVIFRIFVPQERDKMTILLLLEMLKAIANGEQHFSSQATRQIYNIGNPNLIVKNKKTLQSQDIIEKDKEGFAFVDPIYRLGFTGEYCIEISLYEWKYRNF